METEDVTIVSGALGGVADGGVGGGDGDEAGGGVGVGGVEVGVVGFGEGVEGSSGVGRVSFVVFGKTNSRSISV